jgi:hypothetical protein
VGQNHSEPSLVRGGPFYRARLPLLLTTPLFNSRIEKMKPFSANLNLLAALALSAAIPTWPLYLRLSSNGGAGGFTQGPSLNGKKCRI